MIALDTNALVRLIVEDDKKQALEVRRLVEKAEKTGEPIFILTEVLIETVWVFQSIYECSREEIHQFLKKLVRTEVFVFSDPDVVSGAIQKYGKGGDFADLVIVMQAINHRARSLFSFDKKLQKKFPKFVTQNPSIQ